MRFAAIAVRQDWILTFARPRRTARAGHHGGVESPGVATTRRAG